MPVSSQCLANNHSLNIMPDHNGSHPTTGGDDAAKFIGWNSGSVWSPSPIERLKLSTKTASEICVDSFCVTPEPVPALNGLFGDSPVNDSSTPPAPMPVPSKHETYKSTAPPPPSRFVFPPNATAATSPGAAPPYTQGPPPNQPRPITAYNKLQACLSQQQQQQQQQRQASRSFDICSTSTHSSLSVSPVSDPDLYEYNDGQNRSEESIEDILSAEELQELKEALFLNNDRPRPPFTYVCDCCKTRGDHYISDCHLRVMQQCSPSAHTPYQGSNESFGYFKCSQCSHRWQSTRCFANVSQHCKKCNTPVYPMKMFSHQKAMQKGLMPSRRQGAI